MVLKVRVLAFLSNVEIFPHPGNVGPVAEYLYGKMISTQVYGCFARSGESV